MFVIMVMNSKGLQYRFQLLPDSANYMKHYCNDTVLAVTGQLYTTTARAAYRIASPVNGNLYLGSLPSD